MTNSVALAPELVRLREAFIAQVRALIATQPAQAVNEAFYLRQAATAKLGRMRTDVATKGAFSTFAKGELVLVWEPGWTMAQDRQIWHSRNSCCTQVQSYAVELAS